LKSYNSLKDIQDEIRKGQLSCTQLVDFYSLNIREKSHLNVFLEVYEQEARDKAKIIDQKFKNGSEGRLAGMVVGLKDVLCYKDHSLQCSSKILDGFTAQFNATAVERLLEEDAIIIGRTNCDEFAMGSSNENSAYGPALNDIDNTRVPGGSSGGSAVAVQANLCYAALGTDTGGSVRQPAAFCGIVGLKPTYSRISRWGLAAYASSFDTIGIFTRSIADNALLLEIMGGKDDHDSTVSNLPVPAYSNDLSYTGTSKIAVVKETLTSKGLAENVRVEFENVLEFLKQSGHDVEYIDFPLLDYVLPTYYILTTAEASSNLSRYDGVKYGYRSPNTTDLESLYKKSRSEGFGEEVRRRILLGTFVLSARYYDAYYTKAQKVRKLIRDKTYNLLDQYDFIVLPTTPTTAFKIGDKKNPLEMYLEDLFTVQASVSGVPAISIPVGTDNNNMPIGFQIMSKNFSENEIFKFADFVLNNYVN